MNTHAWEIYYKAVITMQTDRDFLTRMKLAYQELATVNQNDYHKLTSDMLEEHQKIVVQFKIAIEQSDKSKLLKLCDEVLAHLIALDQDFNRKQNQKYVNNSVIG